MSARRRASGRRPEKRGKRWPRLGGLSLLFVLCVPLIVCAQESILRFSFDPAEPAVTPGESAAIVLRVRNESAYEADDVLVQLAPGQTGFSLRSTPASLRQVPPFGESDLDLVLSVPQPLVEETTEVPLEVIYTYCAGEVCFQLVEALPLTVHHTGEGVPPSRIGRPSLLRWLIPVLGAVLFAGGIALWRTNPFPLYGAICLLIAGGLAYGVVRQQPQQAQAIGAVLCTSCVGIDEARYGNPTPSTTALAALAALKHDVELLVFYAPWCHSCPYAKAMVEKLAQESERIGYRFVDVDEQRELAMAHGIVRSARTIVPAILRLDTDEVIFGTEDLEARILDLLGAGQ